MTQRNDETAEQEKGSYTDRDMRRAMEHLSDAWPPADREELIEHAKRIATERRRRGEKRR